MRKFLIAAAVLALTAPAARAEVVERQANGFSLRMSAPANAGWAQAYFAVGDPGNWWNGAHTYSGDATNLSLPLEVGACLCERLADGSIFEHGRVVSLTPQREVRLDAPLGPLKGKTARAELAFSWEPAERGTVVLTMTFVVEGQGVGSFADAVDQVMADQFQRWAAWAPRIRITASAPATWPDTAASDAAVRPAA
jgi:hypothetical protein